MWNNFSDNTGDFPKINNMEKDYVEGASGTHLEISLTVFSTWMLSESNPGLDGKKYCWSPEIMSKTIGTICVILERKIYLACCKVLENRKYDTWPKD